MARRGGAEPAQSLQDEIRDLAPDPSPSKFSDPLRAETSEATEPAASPAPSTRPAVPPPTPEQPEGAGEEAYDARGEINRLRAELGLQRRGSELLAREMQL